jgi:AraC-like DNA-binding protein
MRSDEALRVTRHESALGEWELAYRRPAAALQPFVYPYCGYTEASTAFTDRREVPGLFVPVVINLGPPIDVSEAGAADVFHRRESPFVAGMHGRHTIVRTPREQYGVQLNLSPVGARIFFGIPMNELANRVVDLSDILGAEGEVLVERMREARGWPERFDLVDDALLRRFANGGGPSEAMAWTWTRMVAAGGNLDVAALAESIGWSGKRLINECRDQVGLPPKLLSRIIRFDRARALLERQGANRTWACIADACGYYDQAHFSRDFREFAGTSARDYLRMRLPDGGGISAAAV